MIKLIVFDCDDTLLKSSEALYKTDCKTAEALGLKKPSREEYFSKWGSPHKEMIKALYEDIDVEKYLEKYKSLYDPSALEIFPEVINTLKLIKEKGIKLAILSAKQKDFLENHLKHVKIDSYFDYSHSEESSPYKKPDPRVFDNLIKYFNLEPNDILYVGDQTKDYFAASKAGLNFIGVTTGINSKEDFEKAGCRKVIESLDELEGNF